MLQQHASNHTSRALPPRLFLLLYVVGTFGLAWLFWTPLVLVEYGIVKIPISSTLLIVVGTYAPTLTALGLTTWQSGRRGLRTLLGQALRWRVGYRWYMIALCGPALIMGGAVALHILLGGTPPHFPRLQRWPLVLINFVAVLLIGGPFGEEFGWRGLALPVLQQRLDMVQTSVVLGTMWSFWHLPLFFVSSTPQHALPFGVYVAQTLAISIIFTWLYTSTRGSLLIILLAHTAINTWAQPLGILPELTGSLRPYMLSTILLWVGAITVLYHGATQRIAHVSTR